MPDTAACNWPLAWPDCPDEGVTQILIHQPVLAIFGDGATVTDLWLCPHHASECLSMTGARTYD